MRFIADGSLTKPPGVIDLDPEEVEFLEDGGSVEATGETLKGVGNVLQDLIGRASVLKILPNLTPESLCLAHHARGHTAKMPQPGVGAPNLKLVAIRLSTTAQIGQFKVRLFLHVIGSLQIQKRPEPIP